MIHFFGGSIDDDIPLAEMELLGNKGASLIQMSRMGLPVPPGFIIPADQCGTYCHNNAGLMDSLKQEVLMAVKRIEGVLGKSLGSGSEPLLLAVRSGSRISMPGMMDTILNLGLNDITVQALIKSTGDARFALDSYRRLIQMYSEVVLSIPHGHFEDALYDLKLSLGVISDAELDAEALQQLIASYKRVVVAKTGAEFPQEADTQLFEAIAAVFRSWMSERSVMYRKIYDIPEHFGTAVTIQSMVFGNFNDKSATGVVFTRNPSTGAKEIYGEFLMNAQGEDVVSGVRTPNPICRKTASSVNTADSMDDLMPEMFTDLCRHIEQLELHYKDMQDVEFTIEGNKLWLLQARAGKRSPGAAIKIAVDLVNEGLIDRKEGLMRIDPKSIDHVLHPHIDPTFVPDVLTQGLPASPGAVTGVVVFNSEEVEQIGRTGQSVILVRHETSTEDIGSMHAAAGILTSRGGMTSHAAVVARGMGKCCVTGCSAIAIDYQRQEFYVKNCTIKRLDVITIDGSSGNVILGAVPMILPDFTPEFSTVLLWSDECSKLSVRTNADTIADCKIALKFGMGGIGLCRTEHMFFSHERIIEIRKVIVSRDAKVKEKALEALLEMQYSDFIKIFRIMKGLPVNIRLLDPPLHEFLPSSPGEIDAFCSATDWDKESLLQKLRFLKEVNPMLGHRGSRLGITHPEIYAMQTRAIFQAYVQVAHHEDIDVTLEIMLPLIMQKEEFDILKQAILEIKQEIELKEKVAIECQIGAMIEVPRACLTAGKIAQSAAYFSFGTNDLTQAVFCVSRDDSFKFLPDYRESGILPVDPFMTLDSEGVGQLLTIAMSQARAVNDAVKFGVCGEHGGDPESIKFFVKLGMDYISCSPYRIPGAKLAAAQATLQLEMEEH